MRTPQEIKTLVNTALAGESGEFRPRAVFDTRLDCIRVITRDCSVMETRVNELLTVLEANYPRGRKCVGFTIKGADHLCHQYKLDTSAVKITAVLDAVLAACPGVVVEAFVDHVARPLVRDANIEAIEHPDTSMVPDLVPV
jgi:hypothetical protein